MEKMKVKRKDKIIYVRKYERRQDIIKEITSYYKKEKKIVREKKVYENEVLTEHSFLEIWKNSLKCKKNNKL